ncbi:FAD-dependent oxidoreductase [Actinomadura parmotrematis]|uniref:FAD-dependent monooxygenase n=1 Tax=Actinomadura parmotrematis TaxID=2864039 RepID=A0ABS7G2E2_9ACTN|nr:NAD(P)/FAD-dependent oxidoreductase [Actinomadura parmotrematis]MBW8486390.1 FAD-dependent monooxygenase [Actinomadura parmotrematis]
MKTADLKNLDIAIIGAGYGGAAATKALTLLGANVHVYEQATRIRSVGAGIGLRPQTLELFRDWGIFDAMAAVSSPSDNFQILTATGEPIMTEEWPGVHDYARPNHTRFIHRGDFIDTFLKVLPAGSVHLGHRLESITDGGDRSTVTFADGTQVTADLVIGADGIRSLVRQRLFTDKEPVFSGEHAYRAVISMDDAYGLCVDDNLRMYLDDKGTKVYFLPLRHRGQVSYDITALSGDDSWAPDVSRDDLVAMMDGFDERLVDITRDLDMDTVTSRAVFDIDPVDTWHTASVALLGDAAHAMLHHQGQGANQAVQDAGGLADALLRADSVKEALALYQATRKPVTDELQRISRQSWDAEKVDDVFPGQKPAAAGQEG